MRSSFWIDQKIHYFFKTHQQHLLSHYPGLTVKRLIWEIKDMNHGESFSLDQYFSDLLVGIPLEYLSHRAYFFNAEFYVNSDVLIPRSETEGLVEMSLEWIKKYNSQRILDVGCGSGAIILSILQEVPQAINACAVDISLKCLDVAKINWWRLRYKIPSASTLSFIQSDRLTGLHELERFDLIVSNPPYIKQQEDYLKVHSQVLHYEPSLALFLSDEIYTSWFTLFFKQAMTHLTDQGLFLMEGHEDHLENLAKVAFDVGFKEVTVLKDLSNRCRYLKCQKIPAQL